MESESDSDYVPEDSEKLGEVGIGKVDLEQAKEVLSELKTEEIKAVLKVKEIKQENSIEEAMRIAKELKTKTLNQPEVNLKYAGQDFDFVPSKRTRQSLEKVLAEAKKPKAVSSLSKSTLDWEKFKQVNNLEDSLSQNRKDGFIGKTSFLLEAKEREKASLLSLKRKKLN